ncbi:SHOCT domain-containing protein [Kitasatospora griseola]|uniref:SHOCT domain-containing protein n=1 Tax=Kitasatospora griseola TaxID=2064 RepID=UPI003855F7D9
MMYWNGYGMGNWGVGLMALTVLLFLGLTAVAMVVLVRHLGGSAGPRPPHRQSEPRPEPEQLLAERLARGEIAPDGYRRTLEALRPVRTRSERGWTP